MQKWRSEGLRVIVTASSGKAARLINGWTVHKAFKLSSDGLFQRAALEGDQASSHFTWLARADIIVIDEISMLTADAFEGVNEALNFAVRHATALRGHHSFGMKSVLVAGGESSTHPHHPSHHTLFGLQQTCEHYSNPTLTRPPPTLTPTLTPGLESTPVSPSS